MIISLETATYLDRVTKAIDSGKGEIPLTDRCPECEEKIDTWNKAVADDGHVVYQVTSDNYAVLIGCEGYWVTDPTLVGLPKNGWMAADEPVCVLNTPSDGWTYGTVNDDEEVTPNTRCPDGIEGCLVDHNPSPDEE